MIIKLNKQKIVEWINKKTTKKKYTVNINIGKGQCTLRSIYCKGQYSMKVNII